ncbi:: hypothetical protein [Arcticibacter svalbardensis MN12-7]|uniref:Glycoside hydrolase family 125 protein n=1 Tax=Arcticibacter svalbardensis MN12-7 TaxID=1150600 RepID=R9H164_9SPHI|nr:glycoside hydrolase family 125 protein [Arcticibacter svalbardensis]EOR94974.1 : hypothetical protein [Arcticibacter svalbardensis MN12-7]
MKRRTFIKSAGALSAGYMLSNNLSFAASPAFPVVRTAPGSRKFTSKAVEKAITEFKKKVKNPELGWLFENCFPNTLDTTVFHEVKSGVSDTYVITGDIDAMWMRDSSAQVWPYMQFIKEDKPLQQLIAGVINRQVTYILKDPYANAFYHEANKVGEWSTDKTDMKPGVHERKWEIDSLCYPIRLGYHYWKTSGDSSPFGEQWQQAIKTILHVFREQQRKDSLGTYHFQRETAKATDTLTMDGFGYPVKGVGLICSAFRPSDDATVFSFLIPSNFFAVVSLKEAAEMMQVIVKDQETADQLTALCKEVEAALAKFATVNNEKYGKIFAFETDGFGSYLTMDDANVPSLLSLPYLGAVKTTDPLYVSTRKFILSEDNPFYFKGTAAEGIGGPHVGQDMIWPMAIIMRGLTSTDDGEIKNCIETLRKTHGDTGFMHETFYKNDPKKFSRSWFAWANTLFGELLWKTYQEKPHLLV